jgi:hypothetical protein
MKCHGFGSILCLSNQCSLQKLEIKQSLKNIRSRDSSAVKRWATGWMIRAWSPGRGWEIFLLTTASRLVLGPTKPPIQWVSGALSLGVKRPVPEADHSPPSSAEVKNAWSYTSTPPILLHGMVISLKKALGPLYYCLLININIFTNSS